MTPLTVFLRARYGKGFASREAIAQHQQKAFQHLRRNIMPRSPFYAPYADKPLSDWPLMNKALMMEHFTDINTVGITKEEALHIALTSEQERDFAPMIRNIAVGLSTGTSGQRGLFASNKRERALWAALMLGRFSPSFLQRQRVSLFLRANNMLYERLGNALISFEFYDLLQSFNSHLQRLADQQPTVLIAPAQILGLLAQAQKERIINIAPRCIISVAEVLSPEDKSAIETVFGVRVDQVYQCTEGVLGMTCRAGNLHLNEAYMHIERDIIDEASGAFAPIITDLTRETQPVLKYRLDDILIPDNEPCPCGCASLRLKRIEGRCDDILYWHTADGTLRMIPSDLIRQTVATARAGISDYRAVQHGQQLLEIWLEAADYEQACAEVTRNLAAQAVSVKAQLPELRFHAGIHTQYDQKRRRVIAKP
ncbi:hypothetical protein KHQ08_04125 [Pseudochrobactrum algeriensis]|uniref:F390 synthetase-related protein n=1 Tax=Pseudochrobactrum algeriensis TaxID=2834768 RepID=UPI001BCE4E2F|nr:F390 synthetase-related protein [Pseudochrobactrum algeriensis]MBX8812222.1 adenylate synthase [Ochrobactrum sp. MR34]QVQ37265.1 hypothetical protein KHQ08_04125 [Pseudochrobactrum algeriensis]QVQ40483.1 hypothetical protein KHQ07_02420 [Pseudochrobactrum algeriensis]QVQ44406.1 hypothetical protein KHQ09_04395 [Pseudochrobactrum algeriensis]